MKIATLVSSPGGFFTPKDLHHCAIAAKEQGLFLGQRQNIIIPNIHYQDQEFEKLSTFVSREDYYHHMNNIVCSHAAGGLSGDNDWAYNNDAYLEIIAEINDPLTFKVNLCSREQNLFAIFSGHLNFITANEDGYWHLVLNMNKTRQLLPFLFRSNQIKQVIQLINENFSAEAPFDVKKVMTLLSSNLNIDSQQQTLELHVKHTLDHEGFQQMKNGKFSLNIFSNHKAWNSSFISELCRMATRQGLGRIYVTAGRSLLIKHIDEALCFEWQNLIGKYNITLRHSEQDLSWVVPAEKRTLVDIKESIIYRLHAAGLSFQGLYIALDPAEFECGAQIIIRSQKQADKYVYQVFHKEDFDYRRNLFLCDGSDLNFEQLLDALYSLREMFFQQSSRQNIVTMQALQAMQKPETAMKVYQCPHCLTQYHEKVGQPHINISAGTLFTALPENWDCELCGTPKGEFIKLKVDTNIESAIKITQ